MLVDFCKARGALEGKENVGKGFALNVKYALMEKIKEKRLKRIFQKKGKQGSWKVEMKTAVIVSVE